VLDGFRLVPTADSDMTGLFTEVMLAPAALLAVLGEPEQDNTDGAKLSKCWLFVRDDKVFTLYDWKSTSLYDSELWSPEEFWNCKEPCDFNIGSKEPATKEDAEALANALKAACGQ